MSLLYMKEKLLLVVSYNSGPLLPIYKRVHSLPYLWTLCYFLYKTLFLGYKYGLILTQEYKCYTPGLWEYMQ